MRLAELDAKLKRLESGEIEEDDSNAKEMAKAYNFAWRIFTDLVACIAAGAIFGLLADRLFHTLPLFLIIGLVFGLAAGMVTIYKLAVRDDG